MSERIYVTYGSVQGYPVYHMALHYMNGQGTHLITEAGPETHPDNEVYWMAFDKLVTVKPSLWGRIMFPKTSILLVKSASLFLASG